MKKLCYPQRSTQFSLCRHFWEAGPLAAVLRGGWALDEKETKNTSSTYTVGNFDVLMFGSKAIAGYPDARSPVHSPSLRVLYLKRPDGIEKLAPLMTEIFNQCKHFSIMKSGILSFASATLAAFLRYFREFESDMGGSNPILIRFLELCKICNISKAQILCRSDLVREQYEADNLLYKFDKVSRANNDIIGCIVHMHDAVLRLEKSNRKIMTQLQSCIEENQTMKFMLTDYRRENQDFRREVFIENDGSPSQRKRKCISLVSPHPTNVGNNCLSITKETLVSVPTTDTLVCTDSNTSSSIAEASRNPFEIYKGSSFCIKSSLSLDELIPGGNLNDLKVSNSSCSFSNTGPSSSSPFLPSGVSEDN